MSGRKMQTITIDKEIPTDVFCKAFAHPVELSAERHAHRIDESFWFGWLYDGGKFKMGYHPMKIGKVTGVIYEFRRTEVVGHISQENGKTTLFYQRTWSDLFSLIILGIFGIIWGVIFVNHAISDWTSGHFVPLVILMVIIGIQIYLHFPRYNRLLKKQFHTILQECSGVLDMENI